MFQSTPGSSPTRREFRYTGFERYILGGFGSDGTKGIDILRLNGAGDYRTWPQSTWIYDIPFLGPELFGGGDAGNLPYFPYDPTAESVEFPYGAPDGLEDGVVIVLTDSGENINF